jgi:hypothetical protein
MITGLEGAPIASDRLDARFRPYGASTSSREADSAGASPNTTPLAIARCTPRLPK